MCNYFQIIFFSNQLYLIIIKQTEGKIMSDQTKNHTIDNLWRDIPTYVLKPSLKQPYPQNQHPNLETEQNQLQQLIREGVRKLGKDHRTRTNVEILLIQPNVDKFLNLLKKLKIFSNIHIEEFQLSIAQEIVKNQICIKYLHYEVQILKDYSKKDKQLFQKLVRQIIQNGFKQPIKEDETKNTKKKSGNKNQGGKNVTKKGRYNIKKILKQIKQKESQIRSQTQVDQISTGMQSQRQPIVRMQQEQKNSHLLSLMDENEKPLFQSNQVDQIICWPNFSLSDSRDLLIPADENIDQVEALNLSMFDSLSSWSKVDFLQPLNLEQSETEKL